MYIGTDDAFYQKLNDYYLHYNHPRNDYLYQTLRVEKLPESGSPLFDYTKLSDLPHLLFLDFSIYENLTKVKYIISELIFLKKFSPTKSIPVIGLFENKRQIESFTPLFGFGMIFAHLKGDDKDFTILRDGLYAAFEDAVRFPRLALAKVNRLPYRLKSYARLHRFDEEVLEFETDLHFEATELLAFDSHLLSEFEDQFFPVLRFTPLACLGSSCSYAKVQIPYPGPWDELKTGSLMRDTVETWLNNHSDFFVPRSEVVWISCSNHELLSTTKLHLLDLEPLMKITYFSDLYKTTEAIENLLPSLIFFSVDQNTETGKNSFSLLERIIQLVKSFSFYEPYLFIFSSPSGTEALRKVYRYQNIIATTKDVSASSIRQIIDHYHSHAIIQKVPQLVTREYDYHSSIFIDVLVEVTSLTEHEITFLSKKEIPYFSVLRVDVPTIFYVTVVPSIREIGETSGYFHYTALIHSVTEDDLALIRRFIYFMIYQPITKFEYLPREVEDTSLQKKKEEAIRDGGGATEETPSPAGRTSMDERAEISREKSKKRKSKL